MVTSKERDYMYSMYAPIPRAHQPRHPAAAGAAAGERHGPHQADEQPAAVDAGHAGLYYGDEIGMGDNIFLGDRDGVRTPMQWTSDRNGGFSRADPQRLYLPPIQDPIYGFEAVNVEAQSREPGSLLPGRGACWRCASSSQAFGRGRFTMLHPGNRKVLAYVREHDDDVILCVANVSRVAQPVELDLGAWKGRVPVEMMGRNAFPPVGDLPYLLTLPGHGFFWFRLAPMPSRRAGTPNAGRSTTCRCWCCSTAGTASSAAAWCPGASAWPRRPASARARDCCRASCSASAGTRPRVEARPRAQIVEHAMLVAGEASGCWRWSTSMGAHKARYFLPLAIAFEDRRRGAHARAGPVAVSKVRQQANMGVLADAMGDEAFCRRWSSLPSASAHAEGRRRHAALHAGRPTPAWSARRCAATAAAAPDDQQQLGQPARRPLFLKAYRRLQPGVSPELEMGRYLTDVVPMAAACRWLGSVEWVDKRWQCDHAGAAAGAGGEPGRCLGPLRRPAGAAARGPGRRRRAKPWPHRHRRRRRAAPVERVQVLAQRIAELHLALARPHR
jgi:maltose alpha-D-glucosyltransferase / alpha-amylase